MNNNQFLPDALSLSLLKKYHPSQYEEALARASVLAKLKNRLDYVNDDCLIKSTQTKTVTELESLLASLGKKNESLPPQKKRLSPIEETVRILQERFS